MKPTIVYEVFHPLSWGADIAADFFLVGLAVGAFLLSAGIKLYYGPKKVLPEEYRKICRIGAYVALVGLALGSVFLISHLGRPERFFMLLYRFQPSSVLSWGAWIQLGFTICAFWYALLWWRDRPGEAKHRLVVGLIGSVFAIGLGTYHGVLQTVLKASALWNAGPTTVASMLGFVLTGIAAVTLVIALRRRGEEALKAILAIRWVFGFAILAQLFTVLLWIASLYAGPRDAHVAAELLLTRFPMLLWGGAIGLGLILPLALGFYAIAHERKDPRIGVVIPAVAAALVLVGGFILRYVIVVAGQLS
ncbi:polysulfide reductase NrfD [Nitrospinae bacterium AH_259_B05_G02_I21]|nr:polysulfide reductase NrfD [Nitrospinae bacterium AH_259_B05_G02_I21]MDA2932360.1 polysulfide reductase NrfD [Nitrospinae bacterium AH-259-F20]